LQGELLDRQTATAIADLRVFGEGSEEEEEERSEVRKLRHCFRVHHNSYVRNA